MVTLPAQLSPDYRFLAVIGHPIEQSLSPLMHNTAFQTLGMQCLYAAYDIEPAGLPDAVRDLKKVGFLGFSVTIPHKETIIPFLDDFDFESKTLGAVNTVALHTGQLVGYNTDVFGFLKSLEPHKPFLEKKAALVLGSGGAARAVLYGLQKYFKLSEIVLAARSEQKAITLIESMKMKNVRVVGFDVQSVPSQQFSLIVNTTPVGMYPKENLSPLSESFRILDSQIVFDLIPRPLETTLVKRAKKAGAIAMGGLEMLIQQGARAFEIWTGEKMPLEEVRKAIAERLKTW